MRILGVNLHEKVLLHHWITYFVPNTMEADLCCAGCSGGLGRGAIGCQCMGRREAEVWQCRSKLARGLIVRRCLTHFAGGFKAWAYVLIISLACMLGLWSSGSTMHRYSLACSTGTRPGLSVLAVTILPRALSHQSLFYAW